METFHYDAQVRRFLLQAIRLLSNFQWKDGNSAYYRVPVVYGASSRQVATIITQNSENRIPTTPQIAVYISDMKYARDRVQDPTFVDKFSVRTKKYDVATDSYLNQQGTAYSVERIMPVPYELTVRADIWTSNMEQKLQIMEQILCLFNPSLEIQTNNEYLDWTSLSTMTQTNITWSSRSIPQGIDDTIDICSIDFSIPIWISMPAKVMRMGVIEKIISSIYTDIDDLNRFDGSEDLITGTRQAITFQNYGVWLNNGVARLIKANPIVTTNEPDLGTEVYMGESHDWAAALEKYGVIKDNISQLRLTQPNGSEIIGTIRIDPNVGVALLFSPDLDTLPSNTLNPVNAIIDPLAVAPGINGLPAAATGQRYLLLNAVGSAEAWYGSQALTAGENDIIQYDGTKWTVVFDSSANTTIQYVTNLSNGKQYKYEHEQWTKSYEGEYKPLSWRLVL